MEKTCLKCGKVGHTTGNPLDACTHCGAIYAKVEAAHANAGLRPKAAPAPAPIPELPAGLLATGKRAATVKASHTSREQFVEQLRQESLYPTTRWWVNAVHKVVTIFCIIMCVIIAIGALMSSFFSGKAVLLGTFIGAAVFGIFWLFSKISTELAMAVVDMADASVRTAYTQECGEQEKS